MSGELTVVTYHYVRQSEETRYPGIRARRTAEFRYQLDYFRRNFSPVTISEVIHYLRTGDALPPRSLLLTFDDGYVDHYRACFPILADAGLQGSFFPSSRAVMNSELLDVNRIQFALAVADSAALADAIDRAVIEHRDAYALEPPASYRARFGTPNRFDDADASFVKRMLQRELPPELRRTIARALFATYVSADETAFAAELYCTPAQLREMQSCGMYVGSHGATHSWLDRADESAQRREVEESLVFLRAIGSPVDDYWAICYPFGAWNDTLLSILRESGCSLGFTGQVGAADLATQNALLLSRFDTNDFPSAPE